MRGVGVSQKQPRLAQDVAGWSDERFLSELRVVRAGELTRAALLLFGKHIAAGWLGAYRLDSRGDCRTPTAAIWITRTSSCRSC